jgi:hypothetical protein
MGSPTKASHDQKSKAAKVTFTLCRQPDARVGVKAGAGRDPARPRLSRQLPATQWQEPGGRSSGRHSLACAEGERYARHAQLLLLASGLRSRVTEISPGNERGHPGSQRVADVAERM